MSLNDFFSITPNPIASIFIVCVLINIFLIIFLISKKSNSTTVLWFLLFTLFTCVLALSQAFVSMSNNEITFVFWQYLNDYANIVSGPLILFFALSFIGRDDYLKKLWVLFPIAVFQGILSILMFTTNTIYSHNLQDIILTPWGREPKQGVYNHLLGLSYTLVGLTSLILLITFYIKSKNQIKRQQSKLIILGFIILNVGAPITQGLLPVLLKLPAFPSAIILQVILAVLVAYSLTKNGIRIFNVDTMSEKLLELIPSAVLLIDDNKIIEHINPSTEKLLQCSKEDIISQPLKKFFAKDAEYNKLEFENQIAKNKNLNVILHDIQIKTAAGRMIPVDINGTTIKDTEAGINENLFIFTSIQEIKNQSTQLEEKFKEIDKQKSELESLNRLLVDRELNMAELKKQNEKLKQTV